MEPIKKRFKELLQKYGEAKPDKVIIKVKKTRTKKRG
jgi:hypothetical protein